MKLKLEIIADEHSAKVENMEMDLENIVETTEIAILTEIRDVLANAELSDFDRVERIVCIFEEYGIDCGGCHDF